MRSIEGLPKCGDLVGTCEEEVEESDDSSFKLGATSSGDGHWTESLPEDTFTDICGDEEGNTASKSVTFLEHFIEKDADDSGDEELQDDESGSDEADLRDGTEHATTDVGDSFEEGDNETDEFLGTIEKSAIFLV